MGWGADWTRVLERWAALGYLLSRGGAAVPLAPRQTAIKLLHALVRDRRADVVSAACKALGLAGLESALPLPVGVPPPPRQDSAAGRRCRPEKNPKLDDAPFSDQRRFSERGENSGRGGF